MTASSHARSRASAAGSAFGPSSAASSRSSDEPRERRRRARLRRPWQGQHVRAEHGDQVVVGRVRDRRGQVGERRADRGQERRQPRADVLRDDRVRVPLEPGLPRAPEASFAITLLLVHARSHGEKVSATVSALCAGSQAH